MKLSEAIKKPFFWKHSLRLALMFLVLMTILVLLWRNFSDILEFNMSKIISDNFEDGKWIAFFIPKVLIAVFYSMWIISKNMK